MAENNLSISVDSVGFYDNFDSYTPILAVNQYQLMRESDNGSGVFKNGKYLIKHTRERDFGERRNYSFYINHIKKIIDSLSYPIYRDAPQRSADNGQEWLDLFSVDCDKRGYTLDVAMKEAARKAKRYGVYFCVIYNDPVIAANVKDAKEQRRFPYIYFVSPENVESYYPDENGGLSEITFIETFIPSGSKKAKKRFRTWNANGWKLEEEQKDKRVFIDGGKLTLGKIHVVPIYSEKPDDEEDPIMPMPPMYPLARVAHGIYNLSSEIRSLERQQMFSLITYPKMPGDELKGKVVGAQNLLSYNGTGGNKPEYISPDAAIHAAVMASRAYLISQLFEMASLNGIASVTVKDNSGRAKEWDFQATRDCLAEFANEM